MHIFYSDQPGAKEFLLDNTESGHLARVLRLRKDDHVLVINGSGSLYECSIIEPDSKMARLKIISESKNYNLLNYHLHIAIAPTKSIDRFEFFVEKAVEIGISEITPLLTSRSERTRVKKERIEKIIISAMKQSIKCTRTKVNEPVKIDHFLRNGGSEQRLIAHCLESEDLKSVKSAYMPGSDVTILIGPEGDFTANEIDNAVESGYIPISLGTSRLRTETAGITACSLIYFINQGLL